MNVLHSSLWARGEHPQRRFGSRPEGSPNHCRAPALIVLLFATENSTCDLNIGRQSQGAAKTCRRFTGGSPHAPAPGRQHPTHERLQPSRDPNRRSARTCLCRCSAGTAPGRAVLSMTADDPTSGCSDGFVRHNLSRTELHRFAPRPRPAVCTVVCATPALQSANETHRRGWPDDERVTGTPAGIASRRRIRTIQRQSTPHTQSPGRPR